MRSGEAGHSDGSPAYAMFLLRTDN